MTAVEKVTHGRVKEVQLGTVFSRDLVIGHSARSGPVSGRTDTDHGTGYHSPT